MQLRALLIAVSSLGSLFAFAPAASAQIHQDWLRSFDAFTTGNDLLNDVVSTRSDCVYATGKTGDGDLLLLKYDAAGTLAWSRTFDLGGGSGYLNYGNALVVEPGTEAVFVAGRGDATSTQGLLQKYDAAGTLLWTATLAPAPGSAQFFAAGLSPAGNLVAVAQVSASAGVTSIELVAYDPQGNLLWSTNDPQGKYPTSIAFDTNGDILVTGQFYGVAPNYYFGLARFSAGGAHLWTRTVSLGLAGFQTSSEVLPDGAGSAYVSGNLRDPQLGAKAALVKFDAAGNVLWTATHQGTVPTVTATDEGLDSLAFAANGNVRAAGVSHNQAGLHDLQVLEYTPVGQLVWEAAWDGPVHGYETPLDLRVEGDGTLTVMCASNNSLVMQPAVVRFDPQGNLLGADIGDVLPLGQAVLTESAFMPGGALVFGGYNGPLGGTDTLLLAFHEQASSACFGDGTSIACPCGNSSAAGQGRGCGNSGGNSARLTGSGLASLAADTLVLTSAGELASASSLFLQAGTTGAPALFGDGILCLSGPLRRLTTHAAAGGVASAPSGSDPSLSARSAALGDPIAPGTMRSYQVVYRDPAAGFCPAPFGSNQNVSSALTVLWVP
jgi:hypothetical protein